MALDTAKDQERLAEPLSGDDAERLVAYIENPVAPEGHNDYLCQAEQVYGETQVRQSAKP
jgi:hypothetical protein